MSKKFILALLFFLAPSGALAQGSRYDTFYLKSLPAGGVTPVSGLATVCPGAGLATTAASVTGNVATLTFGSNPVTAGFVAGRSVLVVGFSGSDTYFNGTFTISTVTASTITYALTHPNNSASTTGGAIQYPTASSGCAPTTTIYSDQGLTSPITQPFSDDGRGNVGFFATPGSYYVAYSASGLNPMPLNLVTLPLVPNAGGSVSLTSATLTTPTITNPTTTGTDNGAETLQGKTVDVSANTVKNSSNTAGHYLRNNGTKYVDATIPAADLPATTSNCTGSNFAQGLNAGGTPICSASTGGVSEATFGWGAVAKTYANGSAVCPDTTQNTCPTTIFPNAHTIVRFTYILQTAPVGCSTAAVIGVRDITASSTLTSATIANGATLGLTDSGAISVATTAGHQLAVGIITAPAGCTTQPGVTGLTMVYQ